MASTGSLAAQLRAAGAPLPPEAIEPPSSDPALDRWIMAAFAELSTERDLGFGCGPIPASKIRAHAALVPLDRSATETFVQVIRALDRDFLAAEAARIEAERKQPKGA